MKKYAEKFYKSQLWKTTREQYSKSKGYLCEKCLERGLYTTGEIVHHITPIMESNINDPEITLNWDNLQLLCRSCHEQTHRRKAPKRYTVDELGRVTPIGDY